MVGWSTEARNKFREEAFDIITSDKSIKIIAGVCEAECAYALGNVETQDDL